MLISVHVRMFQALSPFVFCLQQIGKWYMGSTPGFRLSASFLVFKHFYMISVPRTKQNRHFPSFRVEGCSPMPLRPCRAAFLWGPICAALQAQFVIFEITDLFLFYSENASLLLPALPVVFNL